MTSKNTEAAQRKNDDQSEADKKSVDGHSGQTTNSSHDEKSHTKAGKTTGAGGGEKQERQH